MKRFLMVKGYKATMIAYIFAIAVTTLATLVVAYCFAQMTLDAFDIEETIGYAVCTLIFTVSGLMNVRTFATLIRKFVNAVTTK